MENAFFFLDLGAMLLKPNYQTYAEKTLISGSRSQVVKYRSSGMKHRQNRQQKASVSDKLELRLNQRSFSTDGVALRALQLWQVCQKQLYFFTHSVPFSVFNFPQNSDAVLTKEGLHWYLCRLHVIFY